MSKIDRPSQIASYPRENFGRSSVVRAGLGKRIVHWEMNDFPWPAIYFYADRCLDVFLRTEPVIVEFRIRERTCRTVFLGDQNRSTFHSLPQRYPRI